MAEQEFITMTAAELAAAVAAGTVMPVKIDKTDSFQFVHENGAIVSVYLFQLDTAVPRSDDSPEAIARRMEGL